MNHTPIETHQGIFVKREDLCCDSPAPPFSKMRGVLVHMEKRPEQIIGVLDTFHSKAGWAAAYAGKQLNKTVINYWAKRKADIGALRSPQQMAQSLGADLSPLPAGRSCVLYHAAVKMTRARGGYMLPNALKLEESIEETSQEVIHSKIDFPHVIVSASSATIAGGVLRGLSVLKRNCTVWVHMGHSRSAVAVLQYLRQIAPQFGSLLGGGRIQLIDEGYTYGDSACPGPAAPFPCNEYYDLKTWRYLLAHREEFKGDVLFWNIGG